MRRFVVISLVAGVSLAGAGSAGGAYRPDTADGPWAACGGAAFPVASLARPAGDHRAHTPSARLLRRLIRRDELLGEDVRGRRWRLLNKTRRTAAYGSGPPGEMITYLLVKRRGRWRYYGSAYGCATARWRAGVTASPWRLDPAFPDPGPDARELHLLVTETDCASGRRADRRVQPPDLFLDARRVVIGMFVRPRPGFQTCQGNPETPYSVELPEPLGSRRLYDGRSLPPSAPKPRMQPSLGF